MRSPLLVAAAVAAIACGKNAEERRFERVRSVCESLVGRTIADAEPDLGWVDVLGTPGAPGACATDLTAWNDRDTCAYDAATLNCQGGWSEWATDPGLCDAGGCTPQPDGSCKPVRCWYGCLVRYAASDLVAPEDHAATGAIPICASRFVSGQPNPPAG